MRPTLTRILMSSVVLALAVSPALGATSTRTKKVEYTGFGLAKVGPAVVYNSCLGASDGNAGSVCLTPKARERSVRVVVEDETGADVPALLVRRGMRDVPFCGTTGRAVRIPEGKEFSIVLKFGGCGGSAVGSPARGVIIAKFSG